MGDNEKIRKERKSVLECRKITIARLRSGVNYKRPLDHIIDSFCYLLKRFQIKNSEFNYGVYNFGYDKAHRRKADDIPDSDIIIIPSENEFHYHIPNYIDPKNLEKSNTAIKEHFKDLKNKHIIILRSDRGDDENLLKYLGGDTKKDKIAGFIYIGHKKEEPMERKRPDPSNVITFI